MQPGVYNHLTDDEYHALPGISNSGLRVIAEYSPAHYMARKLEPREETPALTEGKRIHRCVLEPQRFALEFAVAPKFDMRTNVGKAACAEWVAENPNVTPVDQNSMDRYARIRDAVHRECGELLSVGFAERSVFARDPITGVLVKCRPDFDHDGGTRVLVDLKTCRDVRPDEFRRDAFAYGYHQQAAFYLDVCDWARGDDRGPEKFLFIAVEKEPPFAVRVYEASPQFIQRGRDAYRGALDVYAQCLADDQWPGYDSRAVQLDLPTWAERKLDADQNDEIEGISYVEQ